MTIHLGMRTKIIKGRPPQNGSNNHNFKHGGKGTRLYNIWKEVRKRCNNPNSYNYRYYGGRGISVCKEWDDFVTFRDWSKLNGYNDGLTIDRIDVNGDYCPDNCRWVTMLVQNNNTRKNRIISVFGEKMTISEASRKFNIHPQTLQSRIDRFNWDVERAVTERPFLGKNQTHYNHG